MKILGWTGLQHFYKSYIVPIQEKLTNVVTKSMMSNQQTNNTGKVPTSALAYSMQQSITKLNSDLTTLSQKFGVGSAIKAKGKSDNILYSSYDTGFYWYGASCAGAARLHRVYACFKRVCNKQSDWIFRTAKESAGTAFSILAWEIFSTDRQNLLWNCVQSANGNVAINWKVIG